MKRIVILLASFFLFSCMQLSAAYSPFVSVSSGIAMERRETLWISPYSEVNFSFLDVSLGAISSGIEIEGGYQLASFPQGDLLLPHQVKLALGTDLTWRKGSFTLPLVLKGGIIHYPTLYGVEAFCGLLLAPSWALAKALSLGLSLGMDFSRSGIQGKMAGTLRFQGGRP